MNVIFSVKLKRMRFRVAAAVSVVPDATKGTEGVSGLDFLFDVVA